MKCREYCFGSSKAGDQLNDQRRSVDVGNDQPVACPCDSQVNEFLIYSSDQPAEGRTSSPSRKTSPSSFSASLMILSGCFCPIPKETRSVLVTAWMSFGSRNPESTSFSMVLLPTPFGFRRKPSPEPYLTFLAHRGLT
jgi:hypothetical protein